SEGDVFVLATDGVYEHISPKTASRLIRDNPDDLDKAARLIVKAAYENGSADNLTIQIVRVETLPARDAGDIVARSEILPAPPLLEAGQEFEGYKILRPLHANHRSHIYLVQDMETGQKAALKIPSIDLREDKQALARFMMEDWIARRISSAHVLKPAPQNRPHNYIYTVTEYIEGQTLAQWMTDNPNCDLETMRGIVEQIAKGLRALHRKEMLHQDLRPENIMIDTNGTVKIIDFGAVRVAGVSETGLPDQGSDIPGTMQYTAPEYFLNEAPSKTSDYFSLGVIAYQMLTGRLPYGAQVAKIRNRAQLRKLCYIPTSAPDWLDAALQKMVHPDPFKRYSSLSEFVADIRHPNKGFGTGKATPLAQRDPVKFWQVIAMILALAVVVLAGRIVSLQNAETVNHRPQ
ncbi:MAG TPA: bifunctional protein-serine/threonine kinase/phosphatase, partial [Rhodobacteraceae bacterium]|nr:bifunctional protein-serine/threonine kinase/phosphatase [Paracoccaceae bacterium]